MPTTPPFNSDDYMFHTGVWRSPQGITVPIVCVGARKAYGRTELQVTPLEGQGEAWVQASYVTLDTPEQQAERVLKWTGQADLVTAIANATPVKPHEK